MANINRSIIKAVEVIAQFEGLASKTPPCMDARRGYCLTYLPKEGPATDKVYSYWDRFARIYTIGWGSIYLKGRRVTATDVITRAEADQLLIDEVKEKEASVRRLVDYKKINDNQYATLISIAYNAGAGNLSRSRIIPAIKNNLPAEQVANIIKDSIVTSRGVVVQGLINRRKKEAALYLTPAGILPGFFFGSWLINFFAF